MFSLICMPIQLFLWLHKKIHRELWGGCITRGVGAFMASQENSLGAVGVGVSQGVWGAFMASQENSPGAVERVYYKGRGAL
jgi:hypothetical protein